MERKWWKEAIAYQIYVRSFKDSNGDGIGDIKGIIEKLDYISDLGVNTIYLNPINKSPNKDNGYDISNFRDIMDEFGTLEDFRYLLKEIHKRDMFLIMDLVINHTSDEHPWFKEAKKSKDNHYRDYYIWSKGKDGKEPCNWGSFFGGSAFEYSEETGEYYLHLFSKEQPDLNFENEEVRKEIKKIIKFWIDEGVDGVRLDAINHIAKDTRFVDGEVKEGCIYGDFTKYVQNLPKVHEYLQEIRRDVFDERHVIIGETGGIDSKTAKIYTGLDRKELDFIFHFDLHSVGKGENPWQRVPINLVADIKEKMSGWATRDESEGWCPVFFSNHDTTRTLSRLGNSNYLEESAKLLATLQMTHKGTPFIYNGDEIGMTNAENFELKDYRDIAVMKKYKDFVETGIISHENYVQGLRYTSRDNSRTPMQWNSLKSAGFTEGNPWISINSNYNKINVYNQKRDKDSILNYYKKIIAVRKENEAFIYGGFKEVYRESESIYGYIRQLGNKAFLVLCNFSENNQLIELDSIGINLKRLIISNLQCNDNASFRVLNLEPYESRVYEL